jgi:hypothetical protein
MREARSAGRNPPLSGADDAEEAGYAEQLRAELLPV